MSENVIRLAIDNINELSEFFEENDIPPEDFSVLQRSDTEKTLFNTEFKQSAELTYEKVSTTVLVLASSDAYRRDFQGDLSVTVQVIKKLLSNPQSENYNISFANCIENEHIYDVLENFYKLKPNQQIVGDLGSYAAAKYILAQNLEEFAGDYESVLEQNSTIDEKNSHEIYRFTLCEKENNPLQQITAFLNIIVLECNNQDATLQTFAEIAEQLNTSEKYVPFSQNKFSSLLLNSNQLNLLLYLEEDDFEEENEDFSKVTLFKEFFSYIEEDCCNDFEKINFEQSYQKQEIINSRTIEELKERIHKEAVMIEELNTLEVKFINEKECETKCGENAIEVKKKDIIEMLKENLTVEEILEFYDLDTLLGYSKFDDIIEEEDIELKVIKNNLEEQE